MASATGAIQEIERSRRMPGDSAKESPRRQGEPSRGGGLALTRRPGSAILDVPVAVRALQPRAGAVHRAQDRATARAPEIHRGLERRDAGLVEGVLWLVEQQQRRLAAQGGDQRDLASLAGRQRRHRPIDRAGVVEQCGDFREARRGGDAADSGDEAQPRARAEADERVGALGQQAEVAPRGDGRSHEIGAEDRDLTADVGHDPRDRGEQRASAGAAGRQRARRREATPSVLVGADHGGRSHPAVR
jgi:hypothetical protein